MFKKNIKKQFYVAISFIIIAVLYNNCAPSFQSAALNNEHNGLSEFDNSAPLGTYTGFESLAKSYNCSNVKKDKRAQLLNKNLGPLNQEQYQNSINFIFGLSIYDFPLPLYYNDRNYNTTLGIQIPDGVLVQGYFESAQKVIDEINMQGSLKNKYFVCANEIDTCLQSLYNETGRLLFKRTMTTDEKNKVSAKAKEFSDDKSEQMEAALYLLLTSPQFNYHAFAVDKPVNNGDMISLSEHDVAERLSFFIWGQVPDENLLNLAESNSLKSSLPEVVKQMLQDEKSVYVARALAYNWFNLGNFRGKNTKEYEYTGLRQDQVNWSLAEQVTAYINDLIKNNRPVTELFKSDFQYHTINTAKIYKSEFDTSGLTQSFSKVILDTNHSGAGVLTHIGVLAENSSSGTVQVHNRGSFIIDKVLCEKPVGAPSGNSLDLNNTDANTVVMAVNNLSKQQKCAACHTRMDPLGKGLERFNNLGLYRETYSSTGETINYTQNIGGRQIASSSDLGNYLVSEKKEIINYCATKNILSLAMGKKLFDDGELNERNSIGSCVTLDYFSRLNLKGEVRFQDLIISIVGDGNNLFGQTSKLGQ